MMTQNDRPKLRAFTLCLGVLTVIVGILLLTIPAVVRMGGEWILATLMLGGAVMSGGFAVTALRRDVRIYTSLLTALSLACGLIIMFHPLDTFITLTTLMGIYFMLESGIMGGLGLAVRPHRVACGLMFAVAAISFVMSALIWLKLAGAPKQVIVSLLAISFMARGVLYVALSLFMKGKAPLPAERAAPPSSQAAAG